MFQKECLSLYAVKSGDAWILIALVEIFDINSWVNYKRKNCC